MIELLVVIGIIVLLLAILLPVVSAVRTKAFVATTEAEMQRLMGGIQAYYADFHAYPGPISESALAGGAMPNTNPFPHDTGGAVTSSENLMLGMLGFLVHRGGPQTPVDFMGPPTPNASPVTFTPGDVSNLSATHPATFHYIDYAPEEVSQNGFGFGAHGMFPTDSDPMSGAVKGETVSDSSVPEFLDHIPTAMPILYMRAQVGAPTPGPNSTAPIIALDSSTQAQYNFAELAPYGFKNVNQNDFQKPQPGSGPNAGPVYAKTFPDVYFQNPAIAGQPRGKDSFILISAGADRLYGTKDDIIVSP